MLKTTLTIAALTLGAAAASASGPALTQAPRVGTYCTAVFTENGTFGINMSVVGNSVKAQQFTDAWKFRLPTPDFDLLKTFTACLTDAGVSTGTLQEIGGVRPAR